MTGLTNTQTKIFGAGSVFVIASGLTPVKIGTLQDIEIDISSAVAELYGANQFPEAVGRGKGKITGKGKSGKFDMTLFNNLFYGGTVDTAQYRKVIESSAAVAGASAPTFSVGNAGSSEVNDLGLYYTSNSVQLAKVSTSSAPNAGEYYNTSTGLYTVSTAETLNSSFLVSYDYLSTGNGNQLVIANQAMGIQPVFQIELWEGFTDFGTRTNFDLKLNRCVATKWSFPFKNSDFNISDFEFSCFADSTGNIMTLGVGA
jgi:hypothetical protein